MEAVLLLVIDVAFAVAFLALCVIIYESGQRRNQAVWDSLDSAAVALKRDGWHRDTAYWFWKAVGNTRIWVELEWTADRAQVVPVLHTNDEWE